MPKTISEQQMMCGYASRGDLTGLNSCLARGIDPDDPRGFAYGITPLMAACRSGKFRCAKKLIDWGANVNAFDKEKGTVLMHACSEVVNRRIVEYLLPRVDDVNKRNAYGQTALMLAAANGKAEVVRVLAEHGADVNTVSDNEETPLTFAIVWGHIAVVKILLKARADVNWTDDHGWTPLKYALREKRWAIANLLHDHGAGLAPLTTGRTQNGDRVANKKSPAQKKR